MTMPRRPSPADMTNTPRRRWLAMAVATGLGWTAAPLVHAVTNNANTDTAPTLAARALAALRQPTLRGEARLRFLGFPVYRARLWTEPDFEAQAFTGHALVLELQYERALKGDAIAERSLEEMRRGATLSREQEAQWLAAMRRSFPDIQNGDRLTGLYQPGQATYFELNGQPRPPVRDPAFGPAFFGIWLAEHTSEPALRRQLLGLA